MYLTGKDFVSLKIDNVHYILENEGNWRVPDEVVVPKEAKLIVIEAFRRQRLDKNFERTSTVGILASSQDGVLNTDKRWLCAKKLDPLEEIDYKKNFREGIELTPATELRDVPGLKIVPPISKEAKWIWSGEGSHDSVHCQLTLRPGLMKTIKRKRTTTTAVYNWWNVPTTTEEWVYFLPSSDASESGFEATVPENGRTFLASQTFEMTKSRENQERQSHAIQTTSDGVRRFSRSNDLDNSNLNHLDGRSSPTSNIEHYRPSTREDFSTESKTDKILTSSLNLETISNSHATTMKTTTTTTLESSTTRTGNLSSTQTTTTRQSTSPASGSSQDTIAQSEPWQGTHQQVSNGPPTKPRTLCQQSTELNAMAIDDFSMYVDGRIHPTPEFAPPGCVLHLVLPANVSLLSVHAVSRGSLPGAILVSSDGGAYDTDARWRCISARLPPWRWYAKDFDDSKWPPAEIVLEAVDREKNKSRGGNIFPDGRKVPLLPLLSDGASWIWASDGQRQSEAPKLREAYCRLRISCRKETPRDQAMNFHPKKDFCPCLTERTSLRKPIT